VPNKDFAQELMKKGHSCRFTKDYKDFLRDLGKMSCGFGGKVYGKDKFRKSCGVTRGA